MRTTTNPATAVPRAAEALGYRCQRVRKGGDWIVRVPGDKLKPIPHGSWETLAHLAFMMRCKRLDPQAVQFAGGTPNRGLAGWQDAAIRWLTGGTR